MLLIAHSLLGGVIPKWHSIPVDYFLLFEPVVLFKGLFERCNLKHLTRSNVP